MSDAGFWRLSATELIEGYRRRDFSPVEVTREVFERIERLDPKLSAFLAAEYGRRHAGGARRRRRRGSAPASAGCSAGCLYP